MPEQSFAAKYSSLAAISEFVRRTAEAAHFSIYEVYAIELAVDEVCTNIIEHGYQGDSNKTITCSVEETEQGVNVYIIDEAPPFQPSLPPKEWDFPPLEEMQSRGIGIYLVYHLMDEVRYQSRPDRQGNIITLVKKRRA